jgi:hypothetical protein
MKYTEAKGLPPALLSLLTEQRKPSPDRFSVTSLVDSPQIRQLRLRYWDQIEMDPLDGMWMLFGRLLHGKLEEHAGDNALTEEKLIMDVGGGQVVVGVPDYYDAEGGGTIWDYKFCSVYAAKDDIKREWIAQLNLYALLLEEVAGFSVNHLRLAMMFRDWSAAKAKREEGYPPRIKVVKVPLWSKSERADYLAIRLLAHRVAGATGDDSLPPCADCERWATEPVFAVIEKGKKRATKLHETREEADKHAASIGAEVVERPKEYRRCQDYCDVAAFCQQWKPSFDQQLKAQGW